MTLFFTEVFLSNLPLPAFMPTPLEPTFLSMLMARLRSRGGLWLRPARSKPNAHHHPPEATVSKANHLEPGRVHDVVSNPKMDLSSPRLRDPRQMKPSLSGSHFFEFLNALLCLILSTTNMYEYPVRYGAF